MATYLAEIDNIYYYQRRTPKVMEPHYDKSLIRLSLQTKCPDVGLIRARIVNSKVEDYCRRLASSSPCDFNDEVQQIRNYLRQAGLNYKSALELAHQPIEEVVARVDTAKAHLDEPHIVKSVLGGAELPTLKLSEMLPKFWEYSRPQQIGKSPDELRKWKNPRKRSVGNFISVVGDIDVKTLSREHTLEYRNWWLDRIEYEELSPNTLNKEVCQYLKGVLQTVNTNYEPKLNLDIDQLFNDLRVPAEDSDRPPYSDTFVEQTLLNRNLLRSLGNDGWYLICIMASTGCGVKEIVTRTRDDIVLDHDIPHLHIRPNEHVAKLKTKDRKRAIPLVGSALYAFQMRPNGFDTYRDVPDSLGAATNKYLRENNLQESDKHCLYCLRHTFQDRLTALEIGDRMECELMGHSFKKKAGRAEYGQGPSLEHKFRIMKQVAFGIKE